MGADLGVTFAFTDIEGSTARWERDRVAMQVAVRRHDAILRDAIARHNGRVFKTMGDAFFSAFARPDDAVAAMLGAQRALAAEDFTAVDGLRVRAAINTGPADEREGDYSGPPIDKVARLLSIGHGGQILLTGETAALVEGTLPSDMSLRDLGMYRLKGTPEPQRVYQLVAPGLGEEFPPLRSLVTLASEQCIFDAADFHQVTNFGGRDTELAAIHEALRDDGARAVIHGLGGTGKSSIAREYGRRYRDEYAVVWWLNAQTEDGIIDGFLRLGSMFAHGLDHLKDRRAAAQRVVNSLLSGFDKPVLLVFDNLEDEALLRTWLPRTGTRALVTSRESTWSGDVTMIPLRLWSTETALEFLLRSTGRSDLRHDDAAAIVDSLGALPLALAHAAAALRNSRMLSPQRYLEHISEHLHRAPRGADYPRSVFATFSTAIAQAEQHCAGAAAVLRFAASFAPDAIPDELFRQPLECYPEGLRPLLAEGEALDLRAIIADDLGLDEALGALDRVSLFSFAQHSLTYNMHRLVQLAAQDLAGEERDGWSECAVSAINAAFPSEPEFASWPACERLIAHARAVLDELQSDSKNSTAAELAYRCAFYLFERGDYSSALTYAKCSLAIREALLGPDHLEVARSMNLLGRVYWELGRPAEAETHSARALALRESALGPDHPDVFNSMNALALAYVDQGRYADAERMHLRALAGREKLQGGQHPDVALSLNNLAVVYHKLGRPADAERLYSRALEIWEKFHGSEHPQVALALNNLASVLLERGGASEAEPLCLRSLAIRESVLGPNHPDLAMSLDNLGFIYADLGRYAASEASHLRALALRESSFEPDGPDVAQSLSNLARLYALQARHAEAESMLSRTISIRETALGPAHPYVAESLHDLAAVYRDQGRFIDAVPLLTRALSIREEALGSDHPETQTTRELLEKLRSQLLPRDRGAAPVSE